jgi:integrase
MPKSFVYRKSATKRVPDGAVVTTARGKATATWTARGGKQFRKPVHKSGDGGWRYRWTGPTYMAKLYLPAVRRLIDAWMVHLPLAAEYLFAPINKAGAIQLGRLGPFAVARIVERICFDAGIRDLRTHDLRRTAITAWLYDRRDRSRQLATLEAVVVPTIQHP